MTPGSRHCNCQSSSHLNQTLPGGTQESAQSPRDRSPVLEGKVLGIWGSACFKLELSVAAAPPPGAQSWSGSLKWFLQNILEENDLPLVVKDSSCNTQAPFYGQKESRRLSEPHEGLCNLSRLRLRAAILEHVKRISNSLFAVREDGGLSRSPPSPPPSPLLQCPGPPTFLVCNGARGFKSCRSHICCLQSQVCLYQQSQNGLIPCVTPHSCPVWIWTRAHHSVGSSQAALPLRTCSFWRKGTLWFQKPKSPCSLAPPAWCLADDCLQGWKAVLLGEGAENCVFFRTS
uniref:uncharacterized protein LOC114673014 n=1 Tax=Macaca mulatta TaxID=9544 RepID=UPI0010A25025|nr:uncharacterized protein LOC114673014 [Macaca mulatta]